jgi:hypothetical protein
MLCFVKRTLQKSDKNDLPGISAGIGVTAACVSTVVGLAENMGGLIWMADL